MLINMQIIHVRRELSTSTLLLAHSIRHVCHALLLIDPTLVSELQFFLDAIEETETSTSRHGRRGGLRLIFGLVEV